MPTTGIKLRASTVHASRRDASSRRCCASGGGAICRSAVELVFSGGFDIESLTEFLVPFPREVSLVQWDQNGHGEINPATPLDLPYRQRQREDKRNNSNADRNTPPGYLLERH